MELRMMATAKVSTGNSFSGLIKYVEKEDAILIARNNLFTHEAQEFRNVAELRGVKNPVFHASLSSPLGEKPSAQQWQQAAETFLKEMGFDLEKTQYKVVEHFDKNHAHIHIIANRVMMNGQIISDGNIRYKSHQAVRKAELTAGLTTFEESVRIKKELVMELKGLIDDSLKGSNNLKKFKQNLASRGINLMEIRQKTGRLLGITFEYKEHKFKGSSLSKEYSMDGLKKRGLVFNKPMQNISSGVHTAQSITHNLISNLANQAKKEEEEHEI